MEQYSNLGRGEELVIQAKIHWAKLIGPGILSFLLLVSGLASKDAAVGGILLAIVIMFTAAIPMWTTKLQITNKKIYGKTGLIKTKTLDTPLNKLNTVSVSSGLFGKIFGYGTSRVSSSSGEYVFKGIKSPDLFRQTLMEEIDRYDNDRIKKQAKEMARAMKGE